MKKSTIIMLTIFAFLLGAGIGVTIAASVLVDNGDQFFYDSKLEEKAKEATQKTNASNITNNTNTDISRNDTKNNNTTKTNTITKATNTVSNNTTTSNTTSNNTNKKLDMPENVKLRIEHYFKNNNTGYIIEVIKIGNNAVRTDVSTKGKNMTPQNNKTYHYYKYKGNNTWDDYYRTDKEGWRIYRESITLDQLNTSINISRKKADMPDAKSDSKHEIIHVDGAGNLDTVIIKNEKTQNDLYYSKKIDHLVRVVFSKANEEENLKVYDTSVKSFGISLPN